MKKKYTVFIGSPGDTGREREIISEVIYDLNKDHGEKYDFILETLKWEQDSFPDVGVDGQSVINEQLNQYDIFIGLLSRRFGTPTTKSLSGTAEEFEIAFDKYLLHPDKTSILFYFKNEQVKFLDIDIHQAILVHRFKERLNDLGVLYHQFEDENQFRRAMGRHLLKTIQKLKNGQVRSLDFTINNEGREKTIQYTDWIVTTKKSTPQWANFYEIDLIPYDYQEYRFECRFNSKSDYFRFGYKFLDFKGKVFGDGSIQSKNENILYHIGKNKNNDNLFSTLYQNGIRTRQDRQLDNVANDEEICLAFSRNNVGLITFYMNGEIDEEVHVSPNLGNRIVVLMWGDEHEYEGVVDRIKITLRT